MQFIQMLFKMEKTLKTFYFQREETSQMVVIDQQIILKGQIVYLNHLFSVYCPLKSNIITVYHPIYNKFIELNSLNYEEGCVGKQIMEPRNILIRYKSKESYVGEDQIYSHELEDQDSNNRYDKRSKERSIGEVLQLVKKWRGLHKTCYRNVNQNKKINLQQSAKMVGISKKSLDDYYSQLRLAEKYGFDFKDHLQQKIGILRFYVKQHKQKLQQQKLKLNKLPKNLKIIESDTFDQNASSKKMRFIQKQKMSKTDKILSKMIPQKRIQYLHKMLNYIEDQFYKSYQLFKPEDFLVDPFISKDEEKVSLNKITSNDKVLIYF